MIDSGAEVEGVVLEGADESDVAVHPPGLEQTTIAVAPGRINPDSTSALMHASPCPVQIPQTLFAIFPLFFLLGSAFIYFSVIGLLAILDCLSSLSSYLCGTTPGFGLGATFVIVRIGGNLVTGVVLVFAAFGFVIALLQRTIVWKTKGGFNGSRGCKMRSCDWFRLIFFWSLVFEGLLEFVNLVNLGLGGNANENMKEVFLDEWNGSFSYQWTVFRIVKYVVFITSVFFSIVLYLVWVLRRGAVVVKTVDEAVELLERCKVSKPRFHFTGRLFKVIKVRRQDYEGGFYFVDKDVFVREETLTYDIPGPMLDVSQDIHCWKELERRRNSTLIHTYFRIKFVDSEAYRDYVTFYQQCKERFRLYCLRGYPKVKIQGTVEIPDYPSSDGSILITPEIEPDARCCLRRCGRSQFRFVFCCLFLPCKYSLDPHIGEKHIEFVKVVGMNVKRSSELKEKWEDLCHSGTGDRLLLKFSPERTLGSKTDDSVAEYDQPCLRWNCTLCARLAIFLVILIFISVVFILPVVFAVALKSKELTIYSLIPICGLLATSPVWAYVSFCCWTMGCRKFPSSPTSHIDRSCPEIDSAFHVVFFIFVLFVTCVSLVMIILGILVLARVLRGSSYVGSAVLCSGIMGFIALGFSSSLCWVIDIFQFIRINGEIAPEGLDRSSVFSCSENCVSRFVPVYDCLLSFCDANKRKANRFRRWCVTILRNPVTEPKEPSDDPEPTLVVLPESPSPVAPRSAVPPAIVDESELWMEEDWTEEGSSGSRENEEEVDRGGGGIENGVIVIQDEEFEEGEGTQEEEGEEEGEYYEEEEGEWEYEEDWVSDEEEEEEEKEDEGFVLVEFDPASLPPDVQIFRMSSDAHRKDPSQIDEDFVY